MSIILFSSSLSRYKPCKVNATLRQRISNRLSMLAALLVWACVLWQPQQAAAWCRFTTPPNNTYTYSAANINTEANITLTGTVSCYWPTDPLGWFPETNNHLCMKVIYSGQTTPVSNDKAISYAVKGVVGNSGSNHHLINDEWHFNNTPSGSHIPYSITITAPPQAATLQAMAPGLYSGAVQLFIDMQSNANGGACDFGGGWDSGNTTLFFRYTLPSYCSVSNSVLDFGDISDIGVTSKNYDANTAITTQCNGNTNYSIYLGDGNNRVAGGMRRMNNGSNYLPYQLYKDAARSQIWSDAGSGSVGGSGGVMVSGSGITNTTVFGRIPAGIAMPAAVGAYSDSVVITVTY